MKKNEVKKDEAHEEVKEVLIAPLTQNFGSEDLNAIRDKINEVIKRG